MVILDFSESPMKIFQAGRYIQQGHYKSFQPTLICRAWELDNMELLQLLGQADRQLGRLDMYSEYIPQPRPIHQHARSEGGNPVKQD